MASEYVETEFFRFLGVKGLLQKLAETYPSPRQKEKAPLWIYIASNLSMRLHGVDAFPMVVRTGGMINAFAGKLGEKRLYPGTGEVTLSCGGFNHKLTSSVVDRQSDRLCARGP